MNLYETLQNSNSFYMPPSTGFLPNSDEEREKNQRFKSWVDSQTKLDQMIPTSLVPDLMKEIEKERNNDEFNFYLNRSNVTGSQLNEMFRESERQGMSPVYDFAITNDTGGNVSDPTKTGFLDIQGIMFRGQSTWGFALDPEAAGPEILELSAQSAQNSVYIARRMRGYHGKQNVFAEAFESGNPYLQKYLTPNEQDSQWLGKWADSSPTFYNAEASIPLSAYWKDSVIDFLGRDLQEHEKDWDSKKAIDELKISAPQLSSYLFQTIGVSEDRLAEISKTPLQFKYFITDAIDFYAFAKFMGDYTRRAGAFNETVTTLLTPMLISSVNSNDTLTEAAAVAGGTALIATGVGLPAGVVALGGTVANRAKRVFGAVETTLETVQRIERMERVIQMSIRANRIAGKIYKFLPGQISDTAFEALSKKIPALGKLTAKATDGGFKAVSKFAARQAISEFFQGNVESIVGQSEYIQEGFAESLSVSRMLWNGAEEAIGAPVLGGIMKGANVSGKWLVVDNLLPWASESIGINNVDFSTMLSPRIRNRINLISGMITGVNIRNMNISPEEEARIIAGRYRLNEAGILVNGNSNLGNLVLDDLDEKKNPLVATVIDILSGGNPENENLARATLVNLLTAASDNGRGILPGGLGVENSPEFTKDEMDHLAFMQAQRVAMDQPNNQELTGKLDLASFNHWLLVNNHIGRNKDGTMNRETFENLPDDKKKELQEKFAADKAARETSILSKLGISNIDELNTVFLSPEQRQVLQDVINEEATPGSRVDLGNVPVGSINTTPTPVSQEPTAVPPSPTPPSEPTVVPSENQPTPIQGESTPVVEETVTEGQPISGEPTPQPTPVDSGIAETPPQKSEEQNRIDALLGLAMTQPGDIRTDILSDDDKKDLDNCNIRS